MLQSDQNFKVALLGVGPNYGAAVAEALIRSFSGKVSLTNRNVHLVKKLRKDFEYVSNDNKMAIENAKYVGILVRPDQINAILEEIHPSLNQNQILLNFTAAQFKIDHPKIDIAIWPPNRGEIPAIFFHANEQVSHIDYDNITYLLKSISNDVFEVENCQQQLFLMARVIMHIGNYNLELIKHGYEEKHLKAHLRAVTSLFSEKKIRQVLSAAKTKNGISSGINAIYDKSEALLKVVELEENFINEFALRNTYT